VRNKSTNSRIGPNSLLQEKKEKSTEKEEIKKECKRERKKVARKEERNVIYNLNRWGYICITHFWCWARRGNQIL
jgi:hypothetical protein